MRKDIIKTFKRYGLSITVEANLKVVNFLDVTFNLYSGKFYPYRKPNDRPVLYLCMFKPSPRVMQNIPAAINKRLSSLSCDQQVFTDAAPLYEEALIASGFAGNLHFTAMTTIDVMWMQEGKRIVGGTSSGSTPHLAEMYGQMLGRVF